MERATQKDHDQEIARIHRLIAHIQARAEALQQVTRNLPEAEAEALSEKADALKGTADELLQEVEALENP